MQTSAHMLVRVLYLDILMPKVKVDRTTKGTVTAKKTYAECTA